MVIGCEHNKRLTLFMWLSAEPSFRAVDEVLSLSDTDCVSKFMASHRAQYWICCVLRELLLSMMVFLFEHRPCLAFPKPLSLWQAHLRILFLQEVFYAVMSTMHETVLWLLFHLYVNVPYLRMVQWYIMWPCSAAVKLLSTHLVEMMLLTFKLLSRLCGLRVSLVFWQSKL